MQVAGDGIGLAGAYYGAFYLRFNMAPAPRYLDMADQTVPVIVVATLGCMMALRIYRVMWRYLSLADLTRLAQAVFFGVLVSTFVLALWTRLSLYPRTVLPMYAVLAVVILSAIRMVGRGWFERGMRLRIDRDELTSVLLIGAGRAAELLLNELRANRDSKLQVVGLLDDDSVKQGRVILGAPVLGSIDSLAVQLETQEIQRVVFCIPSAPNSLRLKLLELCSDLGVRLETLPRIADLAEGKITVNQIREVTLSDLLGRDPVALDEGAVASFLNAKTVMITGAGGSIGSEICLQVMRYGPAMVLLFERSELALFQIDGELRRRFPNTQLIPLLGDIQDEQRVDEVLARYQPQVVFHAAAYKHVPLVEMNPFQALANNVGGSHVVARASARAGVDRFVLISTDKAVNPTSFMGATKRIAERVCQAIGAQAEHTRFTTVRFGNVIGSSGSVIPTFATKSGAADRSPSPTRRSSASMTIPEAAQLVLQASTLSDGDETFILDMGQPVKIVDLARQMIRLSGLKEGEDIEIEFTGLRPGEKLYEELMIDGEDHTRTAHAKILRVSRKSQDDGWILEQTGALLAAGHDRQQGSIRQIASTLVDNYQPTHLPGAQEPLS